MKILNKLDNGIWSVHIESLDFDEIFGYCLDICEEYDIDLKKGENLISQENLVRIYKRMKNATPDNSWTVNVKDELVSWYQREIQS